MTTGNDNNDQNILTCSFCNKTQNEVRKLIAGRTLSLGDGKGQTVFICDECIALCAEIIQEETKNNYMNMSEKEINENSKNLPFTDLISTVTLPN